MEIIIYAIITIFIFLRLNSVLGQTDYSKQNNIKDITPKNKPKDNVKIENDDPILESQDDTIKQAVNKINNIEYFNLTSFQEGSKSAFTLILKSFSEGDNKKLKRFVSPSVFEDFNQMYESYRQKNQTIEISVVSIEVKEIKSIIISGKRAEITLEIISEQISFIRDSKNNIIEGDDDTENVQDLWTFRRTLGSSTPDWKLVKVA